MKNISTVFACDPWRFYWMAWACSIMSYILGIVLGLDWFLGVLGVHAAIGLCAGFCEYHLTINYDGSFCPESPRRRVLYVAMFIGNIAEGVLAPFCLAWYIYEYWRERRKYTPPS